MVTIVLYAPEGTSMQNAALVKLLDTHFSSWPASAVKVFKHPTRTAPCVLATITDSDSSAYAPPPLAGAPRGDRD